jgi:hypothetical protein
VTSLLIERAEVLTKVKGEETKLKTMTYPHGFEAKGDYDSHPQKLSRYYDDNIITATLSLGRSSSLPSLDIVVLES